MSTPAASESCNSVPVMSMPAGVFIGELKDIMNLIEKQQVMFEGATDLVPMVEAQFKAVLARVLILTSFEQGEANHITDLIYQSAFTPDQKKNLIIQLNSRVANALLAASCSAAHNAKRVLQTMETMYNYPTKWLLDIVEDEAAPHREKVQALVDLLAAIGLMWPDPNTQRHLTAFLIMAGIPEAKNDRVLQYDLKTDLVKKLHTKRDKVGWSIAQIVKYPSLPSLLPDQVFSAAYGNNDKCQLATIPSLCIPELNIIAKSVPLKNTNKAVRDIVGNKSAASRIVNSMTPAHMQQLCLMQRAMQMQMHHSSQDEMDGPNGLKIFRPARRTPSYGNMSQAKGLTDQHDDSQSSGQELIHAQTIGGNSFPDINACGLGIMNQSRRRSLTDASKPAGEAMSLLSASPPELQQSTEGVGGTIEQGASLATTHLTAGAIVPASKPAPLFNQVVLDPAQQAKIIEAALANAKQVRKRKAEDAKSNHESNEKKPKGNNVHDDGNARPALSDPAATTNASLNVRKRINGKSTEVAAASSIPPEPPLQKGTTFYNGGKVHCSLRLQAWRVFAKKTDKVDKAFRWTPSSTAAWVQAVNHINQAQSLER